MTRRRFALAGTALAAAALLPVSGARAATTWRLAGAYPEGNFQTLTTQVFAEDIANATNGRFRVEVFANASLFPHDGIASAVRRGEVEMGEVQLAWLGGLAPVTEVDSVPFLATDYSEAQRLWQSSRHVFQRVFSGLGMVPLYAVPWPPVGLVSRFPLHDLSDFAGRGFLASNEVTRRFADLVAARPVQVEPANALMAFEAGEFDALFAPAVDGLVQRAPTTQVYYYDVGAWLPKNAVVMAKDVYEPLSTTDQEILIAVSEAAEQRGWVASRLEYENRINTLRGYGVNVGAVSETLKSGLRDVGDVLAREWLARAGFDGEDLLRAYRA